MYLGQFTSKQPDVKLLCKLNKNGRLVVDIQTVDNVSAGRLIHYLGDDTFFPAGVPSVRIHFACDQGKATSVTIRGSVPELKLSRT